MEIKKNWIVVSTNTYDSQPDAVTFAYIYKASVTKGDALQATATCSLFGSKTATFAVGK